MLVIDPDIPAVTIYYWTLQEATLPGRVVGMLSQKILTFRTLLKNITKRVTHTKIIYSFKRAVDQKSYDYSLK